MNETQIKAVELLNLTDNQYFDVGNQLLAQLQKRLGALGSNGQFSKPPSASPREAFPVLAVGAPTTVNLDVRKDIPILVATQQTGRRRWEVNYDQNLHILIADLRTGKLHVGQPFFDNRSGEFEPSMSGDPPDAINTSAVLSSVRRFNLHDRIPFEIRPTRLAITAIAYDWLSNTRVIDLMSNLIDAEQSAAQKTSTFLSGAISDGTSPTLISQAGVAIVVPKAVALNGAIPISGTVKIARARAVVAPSSEADELLLLATILLVRRDELNPLQIDLAVPAISRKQKGIAEQASMPEVVEAVFSFDVRAASTRPIASGTYQIYFVVGDAVYGPSRLVVGG